MASSNYDATIIGAGPSGLACSYTLARAGKPALVIEKDSEAGGLCRTIDFQGNLFDIGGHRFLSKSPMINSLWREFLGNRLLLVKRLSRIYYNNKFFKYPLSFGDTFNNLGPLESTRCIASFAAARIMPKKSDETFEGWLTNRFGKRLYEIFFETYTRKVWDLSSRDISADWAVQRIKGLSLRVALKNALIKNGKRRPKTLAEEFHYPKRGPGEFFSKLKDSGEDNGARHDFGKTVTGIRHEGRKILALEVTIGRNQKSEDIPVDYLFSSMPLSTFVRSLKPAPPDDVVHSGSQLRFRSFLTVNIIVDKKELFPDQWIYVHSPQVKMGRIQNFKNWSPDMIADPETTSLGLEYFCSDRDEIWRKDDDDLISFGIDELTRMGILTRRNFIDGFVIRRKNVYPIYSIRYKDHLLALRRYLDRFDNLHLIGRGGLFRYGNSDHAMLTGIEAAKNYLQDTSREIWDLGAEQVYLET